MPLLMYGSEIWTLNHQQVRQLRSTATFKKNTKDKMGPLHQQRRSFARACMEDIEILIVTSQLRWLGHVSRIEDDRPVKSLLYGELADRTRTVGGPKPRYKDTCKSALKCSNALENGRLR